ncbi:MAG: pentapeptide repeat-containing protein [Candidatus Caenarcaniphilales bacterium]|nr:pentapeptide repeat-containing protein [Candidatus Caenarcaniphilales bacterium]
MLFLGGSKFSNCNFAGLDLRKANFDKAEFHEGCNLSNVILPREEFIFDSLTSRDGQLNLTNVDFEERDLSGQHMRDANLSGTNLSSAIIKGVDFSFSIFKDTLLPKDLTDVCLSHSEGFFPYPGLRESVIKGLDLREVEFHINNLPLDWSGIKLYRANLEGEDLSKHTLIGSYFDNCNFKNTELPLNLRDVYFRGKFDSLFSCDLSDKDFSQSILVGVEIQNVVLPSSPDKIPKTIEQIANTSNPNDCINFLLNALEVEKQFDNHRLLIKNLETENVKEHFNNLIDSFWQGEIEKPSSLFKLFEGFYTQADASGNKVFPNASAAINKLDDDPVKQIVQISDKNKRKHCLNGLKLIGQMPQDIREFWKENILKPLGNNPRANVVSALESLGSINSIIRVFSQDELENFIKNYLSNTSLTQSVRYPSNLIIADNIHDSLKIPMEAIEELARIANLDISDIKIKKLRNALPNLINERITHSTNLVSDLDDFVSKYGLQLSENGRTRFFNNNLSEILQTFSKNVLPYALNNSSFLQKILSRGEINKIQSLPVEDLEKLFRLFAYLKVTNEEGQKLLLSLIKKKLNSSFPIQDVNKILLDNFDERFKGQYGNQTSNKTWSEYMKEFYPSFKESGTRKDFSYSLEDSNISFSTVTDTLEIMNMTDGLQSYACTELGLQNESFQLGTVAAYENGLLYVYDEKGNKIAALLFKALPSGIDISRPYWFNKTAEHEREINSLSKDLASELFKHMGMMAKTDKRDLLRRNTTNHFQAGESEEIGGIQGYNEKGTIWRLEEILYNLNTN